MKNLNKLTWDESDDDLIRINIGQNSLYSEYTEKATGIKFLKAYFLIQIVLNISRLSKFANAGLIISVKTLTEANGVQNKT